MFDPDYPLLNRMANYNAGYGTKYPGSALRLSNGIIFGVWFLGNNYRGSGFFGAYPPQYLARIGQLFPDTPTQVLHLFSGSLPKDKAYTRFDLVQKAEVQGDAEELTYFLPKSVFDLIYADPPYSKEAAKRYGTIMPNRRLVLEQCSEVLREGGFVVWLDTVWPIIAKTRLRLVGTIALLRSCNHVVRTAFLFQKPNKGESQNRNDSTRKSSKRSIR